MAGIYIHIPFCKTKCHYCDFYKTTDFGAKTDFVSALKQEIEWRKNELQQEEIASIYFGGGTPSVLKIEEISSILHHLSNCFSVADDVEITLEANPDDLTPEFLEGVKNTPVNRLSIGTQSFHDADLKSMNRRHNSQQALASIQAARDAGIQNISIDLIYGLPNQTLADWKDNVLKAVALDVQHISAYHLTYHEGTVFYEYLKTGKIKELPDELSFDQFKLLLSELKKAGFEQYEISNFARNQRYSRHNKAYWERKKYLGFGPSAHSFDHKSRRWNVSSLRKYLQAIDEKGPFWETEVLSAQDQYNDYMITSLRTKWGISLNYLQTNFASKYVSHFQDEAEKYLESKHLYLEDGIYRLSDEGLFISDKIMEELFYME
ncbi:radical SAM family heme chaperone HemW [Sunxiuqinia elliptica]|uniref:Heme chaperone HemW n=1 Tax=Sunxiuqinia elliptica TaxID=655355 RepID=A0A1I2B9D9_9BACT|nr:radical SAM family heme chaperone HemW [Sunxiuqinia elliptica]SFE52751.1 oxygen-independent coproporphyrinogen-3 oxidase [Sunxiuqinia elliptica]